MSCSDIACLRIAVHILFKKWELRALGSNLAVNKQSWKTVEMSFLHHDPSLYSPLPGTASPAGQQQSQKGEPLKRQEPPPPLFDGSIEHKPLQLTFTSAAVTSLFNFVKLMDVWFIFLKGAGRPTRLGWRFLDSSRRLYTFCGANLVVVLNLSVPQLLTCLKSN